VSGVAVSLVHSIGHSQGRAPGSTNGSGCSIVSVWENFVTRPAWSCKPGQVDALPTWICMAASLKYVVT